MFAMVGMPLMLIVYWNFMRSPSPKVLEICYPVYRKHIAQSQPRINYQNPLGKFYQIKINHLDWNYIQNYAIINVFQSRSHDTNVDSNSFDGLKISLTENSTYSDYIKLLNLTNIHCLQYYWFDDKNNFYCYFPKSINKLYKPSPEIKNGKKTYFQLPIPTCSVIPICRGDRIHLPEKSLLQNFTFIIYVYKPYILFWILFIITAFFSITKVTHLNHKKNRLSSEL
jgi:hypothetical protein